MVGGGAAGLLAAGTAARRGLSVTVIERNDRMARKVMITGKGRCNLTNQTDLDGLLRNIPQNGRFLYAAFSSFGTAEVMALFEELGVPLKVERGARVFPVSDRAVDVVDALVRYARSGGVKFVKGRAAHIQVKDGCVSDLELEDGRLLPTSSLILCTGGLSYLATGSTGDGYTMARELGHTVTALGPSLVPVEVQEGFCSQLQGLSLKNVTLTLFDTKKNKPVFSELGEMLFTHYGLSGPLVLSASAHMRPMEPLRYRVCINLKPGLTSQQLDNRLQRDLAQFSNRDFRNCLDALLPQKLIPVILRQSGIPPVLKANQVTREMRYKLIELLQNLSFGITKLRPVEEAVVTTGGVSVKQINPSTMQSKLVKGLYFAGEIIDVDAYTGGYNLQIAFSTGHLAGSHAGEED